MSGGGGEIRIERGEKIKEDEFDNVKKQKREKKTRRAQIKKRERK